MTTEHDLTGTDGSLTEGESAVLTEARKRERALQAELKDLKKELSEYRDRDSTARASTAEELMNTLGLPGLVDDVLEWVEGDITEDSVTAALKQRSIPVDVSSSDGASDAGPQDDGTPSGVPASTVGQRVADAAANRNTSDIDERLQNAETIDEVKAIMAELGTIASHS